jgi:hypothetical protein
MRTDETYYKIRAHMAPKGVSPSVEFGACTADPKLLTSIAPGGRPGARREEGA